MNPDWFGNSNAQGCKRLQSMVDSAKSSTGIVLRSIKSLKKVASVIKDPHHALFLAVTISHKVEKPEVFVTLVISLVDCVQDC